VVLIDVQKRRIKMAVRELCRYVPQGYELVAGELDLGIEVYANPARFVAMGFSGRRNRPDFNYRFGNLERMNEYIAEYINGIREARERVAQRRADRIAANRAVVVNVGDVFRAMWGYDQTNIDYYQVVAVNGQMMEVREIGCVSETTGYDQGVCVPAPDNFVGQRVRRVRVQASGNNVYFRVNSFSNAYRIEPVAVVAGVPIFQQDNWTAYA
jgi:hypothetical protein